MNNDDLTELSHEAVKEMDKTYPPRTEHTSERIAFTNAMQFAINFLTKKLENESNAPFRMRSL